MSESVLVAEILIALGRDPRCKVWRNNSGALPDARGRVIRFGLAGSADILGLLRPSGRFLAIEVKTPIGRQTTQQIAFQRMITDAGGLYILAHSSEEALHGIAASPY